MKISRMAFSKRLTPLWAFVLVLAVSSVSTQCSLPSGCSSEDIPSSALSSNLVDYTYPASGSILQWSEFQKVRIKFLRPILTSSFEVEDDIRMFFIVDFWDEDRFESEITYPLSGHLQNTQWTCEECDPEGLPDIADTLEMDVSGLYSGLHYRFRLKGKEPADEADPGVPPSNYILSTDGAELEHDVDFIVGLIADNPPDTVRPRIVDVAPIQLTFDCDPYAGWNPFCYVAPHASIRLEFSELMGYANLSAQPLWGVNFVLSEAGQGDDLYSVIKSSSPLGLDPGAIYELQVSGLDPPIDKGVAKTCDRYGNSLDTSYSYAFEAANVRIVFPVNTFQSEEPADWGEQLKDLGFDDHYIIVEVTPEVAWVAPGQNGKFYFPGFEVPGQNRTENSTHLIHIEDFEICVHHSWDIVDNELLSVDALGPNWEYLGTDYFQVDPLEEGYEVYQYPEYYELVGEFPSNFGDVWTDNLQGVANDNDHWYITDEDHLWKVPVERDLVEEFDFLPSDYVRYLDEYMGDGMLPNGYNHFGDLEVVEHEGEFYVFIPVTGAGLTPQILALRGSNLDYLSNTPLTSQNGAGWCAVRREGEFDILYTSESTINEQKPMRKYKIHWEPLGAGYSFLENYGEYTLWANGSILDIDHLQGGDFSEVGNLYLVNGIYCDYDVSRGGIRVFDARDEQNGYLFDRSTNGYGTFNFQWEVDCLCDPLSFLDCPAGNEPEGITIFDLDDGRAPGISGQIHVLMINNEASLDNLFFRHYSVPSYDKCKI